MIRVCPGPSKVTKIRVLHGLCKWLSSTQLQLPPVIQVVVKTPGAQ